MPPEGMRLFSIFLFPSGIMKKGKQTPAKSSPTCSGVFRRPLTLQPEHSLCVLVIDLPQYLLRQFNTVDAPRCVVGLEVIIIRLEKSIIDLVHPIQPAQLARHVIPDADIKRLSGDVAAATKALGEGAGKLVGQIGGEAGKALEGVGDTAKKTGEAATKGIGDGLKGLLGGDKKADTPQK